MASPIPRKSTNYEEPIEILWFNNFLKTRRLEREVEVLRLTTDFLREKGGGFRPPTDFGFIVYRYRTPFGYDELGICEHENFDWELILNRERYLELRTLELSNHKRNLRRYLMERDSEIAMSYNRAYTKEKNPSLKPWVKPFYLGRILTNPLNTHSTSTMEENYVEPIFGSIVEVSNNLKLKNLFREESLKEEGNYNWYKRCILEKHSSNQELDSQTLRVCFIDPLKKRVKKDKDYQEYIIQRAESMEKGLIPKPRY